MWLLVSPALTAPSKALKNVIVGDSDDDFDSFGTDNVRGEAPDVGTDDKPTVSGVETGVILREGSTGRCMYTTQPRFLNSNSISVISEIVLHDEQKQIIKNYSKEQNQFSVRIQVKN